MALLITRDPLKSFLENIDRNENVFFTGSRKFGMENTINISDYDYVIIKEDWKKIDLGVGLIYNNDEDKYKEFLFKSIHLLLDDKNYNMIIVDSVFEFRVWKYATKRFLTFIEDSKNFDMMRKKENRIKMFELLKQIYRDYYAAKRNNE